jgi:hypothetical protein
MKNIKTSVLLLVVLFLSASFMLMPKGNHYKSSEGKLSVDFPAEFTTDREQGDNFENIKTTCIINGQTYLAVYTLHEVEMTNPEELAQVSYDSFLSAVEGKMITKNEWVVDDNVGIKAIIDMVGKDMHLEYRVILRGNIQYQFLVMANSSDYDGIAANDFFKSIKFSK